MRDVADAFPRAGLTRCATSASCIAGCCPAKDSSATHVSLPARERRRRSPPRWRARADLHVRCSVYDGATHRRDRDRRGVRRSRQRDVTACATAVTPVIGGDIGSREQLLDHAARASAAVPRDVLTRLALTYGSGTVRSRRAHGGRSVAGRPTRHAMRGDARRDPARGRARGGGSARRRGDQADRSGVSRPPRRRCAGSRGRVMAERSAGTPRAWIGNRGTSAFYAIPRSPRAAYCWAS